MKKALFRKTIWDYYKKYGRALPWRLSNGTQQSAYKILVSELMLQQTQVDRVIPKYEAFLKAFPTLKSLAHASQRNVLALWSGLGYNRRALYLKRIAETVEEKHKGKLPQDEVSLLLLPGIGPYTARAVAAFAWNIPGVCIETNIRSVYIHFFFKDRTEKIHDKEFLEKIAETMDTENPREWYWALMDYGAYLKKEGLGNNSRAKTYTKQKAFKGSEREVRGGIMKYLTQSQKIVSVAVLIKYLSFEEPRIMENLKNLQKEGFLKVLGKKIELL